MDIKNAFSLEGKVALVTGGTYGIGFAIGSALAQAGAKVVYNCRSEKSMNEGIKNYAEAGITEAYGYYCDVTKEEDIVALVQKIEEDVYGKASYIKVKDEKDAYLDTLPMATFNENPAAVVFSECPPGGTVISVPCTGNGR